MIAPNVLPRTHQRARCALVATNDITNNSDGTLHFCGLASSGVLAFAGDAALTSGSDLTGTIDGALFSFDSAFTSSWNSSTSNFTITAIPEPSTYVAAAGLLAAFLWPSRRRLLKDARSVLGPGPRTSIPRCLFSSRQHVPRRQIPAGIRIRNQP